MAKSTSNLIFTGSPNSTRERPLVNINGDDYEVSQIQAAQQAAAGMLPSDTFSRTLAPFAPDASKTDAKVPANDAAGLTTPK